MDTKKEAALFCFGGGSYVAAELLYRGRSHISMFAAGGLCFLLLGRLEKKPLPLGVKAVLGAAAITGVELATGLLVNRDYAVWDYRDQPHHFLGQICPRFCALWAPVSVAGMGLYRFLDRAWEENRG